MLGTIVKKELLENLFSYRFPLFAVLCFILIPLGMSINHVDYNKRVRDYNEQMRLADEASANLKLQDIMAGTVAIKGFRRPAPLSVLSRGLENTLPRFYEFSQEGSRPGESASGDESVLSVQGKFDFVFLIQMIISLIGLLFASDLISGEKESGTLRLMLSNRLPRDTVLEGKVAGGYLAIWVLFATAFLLGAALLILGAFPLFSGDAPGRFLAVLAAASVFILIYYVVGIAVSANTSRTRTSLISILLIWVAFQLVLPKIGDVVAGIVHPIRTETAVSLEKSLLANSIETEAARELGRQYDLIFGTGSQEKRDDLTSPERKKWDSVRAEMEQSARDRKGSQLSRIDEAYSQKKRRQRNLALNISLLSPSAAFARLVSDICGTGEIERSRYMEAVQSHQRALERELFSKVKRTLRIHPDGRTALMFETAQIDFKNLPKFAITPSPLGDVFKANWRSLLSLAFWLIAPFVLAYLRFIKYDVR